MGAAEMQEIAAIIAGVLRATAPTKTASRTGRLAGKPSLANYTLEEAARSQAEGRARDLLGRFPLYRRSSFRACPRLRCDYIGNL